MDLPIFLQEHFAPLPLLFLGVRNRCGHPVRDREWVGCHGGWTLGVECWCFACFCNQLRPSYVPKKLTFYSVAVTFNISHAILFLPSAFSPSAFLSASPPPSLRCRYFEKEVISAGILADPAGSALNERAPDSAAMQALDVEFIQIEKELLEINGNQEELQAQELHLLEMKEILQKTSQFFDSNDMNDVAQRTAENQPQKLGGEEASLLDANRYTKDERGGQLGFVTGVIPREKSVGCPQSPQYPLLLPSSRARHRPSDSLRVLRHSRLYFRGFRGFLGR